MSDPLDFRQVSADSFDVAQSRFGLTRFGLTGRFGWRERRQRGLYGMVQSTVQTADKDAEDDTFLDAIDESAPALHGRARLGARYVLFQGDLDVDMYVVGRFWSAFASRVYDPVTGMLALPASTVPEMESGGTLDIRLEAGIRSATAYVGMENILASVSYPGVMVVPYYPLPAQTFRFGVFWPINN